METHALPDFFKPIFWDADFNGVDIETNASAIIERTINYGDLPHWRFLVSSYGKEKIQNIVAEIPASAFRPQALRLAELILGVHTTHALRSAHR